MFFSLSLTHSFMFCQACSLALSLSLSLPQPCVVKPYLSLWFCQSFFSLFLCHSCCPTLVLLAPILSLSQVFCSQSFSATLVVSLVFCSPSSLTLALSIYSVHFRSVTLAFLTMFSQSSSVSRLLSRLFFESVFES